MRLPQYGVRLLSIVSAGPRADEGTRTPDRLITNQLLYQLSYIGFCQPFKLLSFSRIEAAKILLFPKPTNIFLKKNDSVFIIC